MARARAASRVASSMAFCTVQGAELKCMNEIEKKAAGLVQLPLAGTGMCSCSHEPGSNLLIRGMLYRIYIYIYIYIRYIHV